MKRIRRGLISQARKFNDGSLRLFGSPILGLLFAAGAGLSDQIPVATPLWFVGVAFTAAATYGIWTFLSHLGFRVHSSGHWGENIYRTICLYLSVSLPTTSAAGYGGVILCAWLLGVEPDRVGAERVAILAALTGVLGLQLYIGLFSRTDAIFTKRRVNRMRAEESRAQLTSLMCQQDPKSMLSALRTLRSLITIDLQSAGRCAEDFVAVHRYILSESRRDLVILREELDFLRAHARVLRARFGTAFVLDIAIPSALVDQYLIVPASLHLLLENAFLFNHMPPSKDTPLRVDVRIQDGRVRLSYLWVFRPLSQIETQRASGLAARIRTVTGKELQFERTAETFAVSVPLLPLSS